MTHHSVSAKVFSAILSLLMAAQVFPLTAMADSITIDTEYSGLEAFPDYEPEVVCEAVVDYTREIPETFINEEIPYADYNEDASSSIVSDSSSDEEIDFNSRPYIRNSHYISDTRKEEVNKLTGELTLSSTDYVLKGKSGLDLVIGHIYSSQYVDNRYVMGFTSYNNIENETESSSHVDKTDYYSLGSGTFLAFSHIDIDSTGTKHIIYLSDGRMYHFSNVAIKGNYEILNYKLKDISISSDNSFSNGRVHSRFVLKYKDGKKEYFSSDGNLIGIKDKNDNCITFINSLDMGFPTIEIIDSLNQVTTIQRYTESDGYSTKIEFPNNVYIDYHIKKDSTNTYALAGYCDPMGNTTHYSYYDSVGVNSVRNGKTLALKTITYSNGLSTEYTYEKASRIVYATHGMFNKLKTREDSYKSDYYNYEKYIYDKDYITAHEEGLGCQTSILDSLGKYTTSKFDKDGRILSEEIYDYQHLMQKNDYVYKERIINDNITAENILPIKITNTYYNDDSINEKIRLYSYDDKGNIIKEWSELASGNSNDTEYLTTYTYSSDYNILIDTTYNDEIIDYDAPGNINYGYLGKVFGFLNITLYIGAGVWQIHQKNSSIKFALAFFDDPRDHVMIKKGINIYKMNH